MLLKFTLSSLSILIISVLNAASSSLLVSILFSSFSGVLFFHLAHVCLLSLATYVCFHALGRAAMSPRLCRVDQYSRCPAGSRGTASLIIQVGYLRCAPLWGPCPPSSCSWAMIAVGTSMGRIYLGQSAARTSCDHQTPTYFHHGVSDVQGPDLQNRTYFSRTLVPAEFSSWVCCLSSWLGGGASMWSQAVHWVCSEASQEVQAKISNYPCSAWDHRAQSADGWYLCRVWKWPGKAKLWTKASCCYCQAWGHLGLPETRCWVFFERI